MPDNRLAKCRAVNRELNKEVTDETKFVECIAYDNSADGAVWFHCCGIEFDEASFRAHWMHHHGCDETRPFYKKIGEGMGLSGNIVVTPEPPDGGVRGGGTDQAKPRAAHEDRDRTPYDLNAIGREFYHPRR